MCVAPWASSVVVHPERSPVKQLVNLTGVGHRLPVGSVNLHSSVLDILYRYLDSLLTFDIRNYIVF